jgi:hypothetical protein
MQSFSRLVALVAAVVTVASACVHVQMKNDDFATASASESTHQFQKVVYQNSGGLPDDCGCFAISEHMLPPPKPMWRSGL